MVGTSPCTLTPLLIATVARLQCDVPPLPRLAPRRPPRGLHPVQQPIARRGNPCTTTSPAAEPRRRRRRRAGPARRVRHPTRDPGQERDSLARSWAQGHSEAGTRRRDIERREWRARRCRFARGSTADARRARDARAEEAAWRWNCKRAHGHSKYGSAGAHGRRRQRPSAMNTYKRNSTTNITIAPQHNRPMHECR